MTLARRLAGVRAGWVSRARVTRPRVLTLWPARRSLPDGLAGSLRTARLEAGLTQRAVAERAGVARSMVSMIENGRCSPGPMTVNRLAAALRLDEETHQALLEHASPYRDRRPLAERIGRAAATPWRLHDLAELRRLARLARREGKRGLGGRPRRRARLGLRPRSRKEVSL